MAVDVEPTELDELDVAKVSGVEGPANGVKFLVLKASADVCSTCDGTGKIMDGKRDCPDCDGPVGKAEADDIEDELTDGDDDSAEKAAMSSADQNDLPDSAFAHIEAGGKKDADGKTTPRSLRHFPIHDAAHVRNALARVSQSPFGAKALPKITAAAKKFGIKVTKSRVEKGVAYAEFEAVEKSPGNPPEAMEVEAHAPLIEGSGKSGLSGVAVVGVTPTNTDPPKPLAGETPYMIPAEAGLDTTGRAKKTESVAFAVSTLAEAMERIMEVRDLAERAQKAGLGVTVPEENIDPETVEGAAKALALLVLDEVTKSDESVEKVGRRISGMTMGALTAARDHLTSVIGDGGEQRPNGQDSSEEEKIQMEVTKEELAEMLASSSGEAAKAATEATLAALAKNANNGGDISEGELHENGTIGDDLNLAGSGTTRPGVTKAEQDEDNDVTKQLEEVKGTLSSLEGLVTKMASQPRRGGPHLTGQLPAGLTEAVEGRQGEQVAKSEDEQKIETLAKQLEDARSDTERANIGYDLTLARLTDAHKRGVI